MVPAAGNERIGGENKMHIVVVDDDKKDLTLTKEYLVRYSIRRNEDIFIHTYQSGAEFFGAYHQFEEPPVIIFLDIEMEGQSGLDVASALRNEKEYRGEIIFFTSYPQFMIDSFDFGASQYLLKPLEYLIFEEKLDGVFKRMLMNRKMIVIKEVNGDKLVVPVQDIISIHPSDNASYDGILKINTVSGDYEVSCRLKDMESQLKEANFLLIHRKNLVNLHHVKKIFSDTVILSDDKGYKVGRTKKKILKERFMDFMIE